jgi:hypothetical protein
MQYPMINTRKPPGLRGEAQVARMRITVGTRRPFSPSIRRQGGGLGRPAGVGVDRAAGAIGKRKAKRLRGAERTSSGGFGGSEPVRAGLQRRIYDYAQVARPLLPPSEVHVSPTGAINRKRFRGVSPGTVPTTSPVGFLGGLMGHHFGD